MEDFVIIASQTLTNEEEIIYLNSSGAVIKTILLNAPIETEVSLMFDGIPFLFLIKNETTVISTPILTRKIEAFGDGVNIHITGLQL